MTCTIQHTSPALITEPGRDINFGKPENVRLLISVFDSLDMLSAQLLRLDDAVKRHLDKK
jgi:hypothetical protein